MIKKLFQIIVIQAVNHLPRRVWRGKVFNYFKSYNKPIEGFDDNKVYFHGKNGLEIEGPSSIFSSILPIYGLVKNLDNCNFSSKTVWEDKKEEGLTFNYYRNRIGYQFIREATDLKGIKSEKYDFVISSHVLEHIANPLKALFEWKRVLKNGGIILLVIPHKQGTFDHKRPITKLDHLIEDYENEVDERDMTHLTEILKLHDLSMDPKAGTYDNFVARSKDNFKNRCLHHHIFITESIIRIIDYVGLKTLHVSVHSPYNIIILGQKIIHKSEKRENHYHNLKFLDKNASWRRSSPFTLDKNTHVGKDESD